MDQDFKFDVFLSYSSKDKTKVRRIAEQLRTEGLNIWFDEWSIPTGDDILLAIEEGLLRSKVLVVCLSDSALGSDWVNLERSASQFLDPAGRRRKVIPLLLEPCDKVPPILARLKKVDYYSDQNLAIDAVVTTCGAIEKHNQPIKVHSKVEGILFVDDEDQIRKYFFKQFGSDFPIHLAESVDEALLILKSKHAEIAVAVVDQRLPRRKGTDLLAILRRTYPKILRILVSAHTDYQSLVDAINVASVHGYLYKPWDEAHMRLTIDAALEAFAFSETMPGFALPIEPPLADGSNYASNTAQSREAVVAPVRFFEEFESQRQLLQEQAEKMKALEQLSSMYVKHFESKDSVGPGAITRDGAAGKVMSCSVKPTLEQICQQLTLLDELIGYGQPKLPRIISFLRDRNASYLSKVVAEVTKHFGKFTEDAPITKQENFIAVLKVLSEFLAQAKSKNHGLHHLIRTAIGADACILKLSQDFSVLVRYLGLQIGSE